MISTRCYRRTYDMSGSNKNLIFKCHHRIFSVGQWRVVWNWLDDISGLLYIRIPYRDTIGTHCVGVKSYCITVHRLRLTSLIDNGDLCSVLWAFCPIQSSLLQSQDNYNAYIGHTIPQKTHLGISRHSSAVLQDFGQQRQSKIMNRDKLAVGMKCSI